MLNPLWIRHCEVGGLSRLMVICFLKECRNLTQFRYLTSQSKFHIYTFQHLRTIDGQLQKIQEINARHLVMSVKMIFFWISFKGKICMSVKMKICMSVKLKIGMPNKMKICQSKFRFVSQNEDLKVKMKVCLSKRRFVCHSK